MIVSGILFFHLVRFIRIPTTPNIANNWSIFPKSKQVKINQQINGSPIICPIRIINEYDIIDITRNVFFILFC